VSAVLTRLGLELHPEKTRVVGLSWGHQGFDFLGCHLRKRLSGPCGNGRTGASISDEKSLFHGRSRDARPLAIPLAAGVLAGQGIVLHPAVGAVLMSASTVVVAINAQLLRRAAL
jgi:hypothetical protein